MEKKMGQDFPWLVFKLFGRLYAVNSATVSGIQNMPPVEAIPDPPQNIRGIFTLRGMVIPLLELRSMMGMGTLQQENEEFIGMLEQRKQDHIFWAEELERCISSGDEFTLATDPHKCAFGRWYDSYQSELDSVNHHLRKIEAPHQKLHEAALAVQSCDQQHEACKRQVCLKTVLHQVQEEYVPKIVGLLDEAKDIFRDSLREMVIVLDDGVRHIGIAVDEVVAVRPLTAVEDEEGLEQFGRLEYVRGVSRDETSGKLILMLDDDKLLELVV